MTTDLEKARVRLEVLRKGIEQIEDGIDDRSVLEYVAAWVKEKPRFRVVKCCSTEFQIDALEVYFTCPSCKRASKLRGFGPIYDEVEDLIVTIRDWLAKSE